MKSIQGTAIIRDRGQLTIPEKIRSVLQWSSPNSVVSLMTTAQEELIIKPFQKEIHKEVDWDNIWDGIKWARSIKGKRGNLSEFLIHDRERHNLPEKKDE